MATAHRARVTAFYASSCASRPPRCAYSAAGSQSRLNKRADQVSSSPVCCNATQTVDNIDRSEYVSGYTEPTLLGRIVEAVFPPHVRFFVCWISPLLTIASCHAVTVMATIGKMATVTQAAMPCLASVFQLATTATFQKVASATMYTLPILFTFVLLPILDYLLGEEEAQAMDDPSSSWQMISYRSVCIVFAALQITAVASAAFVASRLTTPWPLVPVLALNCAVSGAHAFMVGHELIHSRSKLDRFTGQILLTLNCYKHWGHSHMAHHAQVATPADPASARYREAVYPFVFRCVSGEWSDAVRMELKRVGKEHPNAPLWQQLLHSNIPGWIAWPAAVATVDQRQDDECDSTVQMALGMKALALFGMAAGGSIFFLSVVNYVEHYGLVRPKLASGKHVPVSYNHSWNANHLVSNASLLRLQRHTDHHMHATKPFYRLENVEGAPRLPGNYSMMILLALLPPLWFWVMNPRVHLYKMLSEVGEGALGNEALKPPSLGGSDDADCLPVAA